MAQFPATPIRDDFNRADSTTTIGGSWAILDAGTNDGGISTNQAYHPDSGNLFLYWNGANFGTDHESYISIPTFGSDTHVGVRLQDVGTANWDGYAVRLPAAGTTLLINRWDNASATQLGASASVSAGSGDKVGCRATGNNVEMWLDDGTGWASKGTRTDSTYTSGTRIGWFVANGSSPRYDDFGGGSVNLTGHIHPPINSYVPTFTDNKGNIYAVGIDKNNNNAIQIQKKHVAPTSTNFPTTGIIDDFNRADSSTTIGSNWSITDAASFDGGINSNQAYNPDGGNASVHLNTRVLSPDQEVYVDIPTFNTFAIVQMRLRDVGTANVDGYRLSLFGGSHIVERIDNGTGTQLGASFSPGGGNGDKIGLRGVGSTIEAWHYDASGGATWVQSGTRSDSTYPSGERIGLIIVDNITGASSRYDNFGGGSIGSSTYFEPQDISARPVNANVQINCLALGWDSVNQLIHMVYAETGTTNMDYRYARFATHGAVVNANTWRIVDELIDTVSMGSAGSGVTGTCRIEYRGTTNSEVIITYQGAEDNNKGTKYQRVDIATRNESTSGWTTGIQVEGTSGSQVHYIHNDMIKGASGKVYVVYRDHTNGNLRSRSYTGSTLGTARTVEAGIDPELYLALHGGYYDAGGTERITIPYRDSTAVTDGIATVIINNDGTPDATRDTASGVAVKLLNTNTSVGCLAIDSGNDKAILSYVDNATSDIWRDENTNDGGWGTDTEDVDNVTALSVFNNFYNDTVVLIYQEGTDLIYVEITTLQTIVGTGIASGEAFGTTLLHQQVLPTALASQEAYGTPTMVHWIQGITGIASGEAFEIGHLLHQWIFPTGFEEAAFGTHLLNQLITGITGIPSAEVVGTPSINLSILPTGIVSIEAFGSPTLYLKIVGTGIVSAETFGTITLIHWIQGITGIPSEETIGSPLISQSAANLITPAGINSEAAFGSLRANMQINTTGITSAELFGTTRLSWNIFPIGIAGGEVFGTHKLNHLILAQGIDSLDNFGEPFIATIIQVFPSGIPSEEDFGVHQLNQIILPTGIGSIFNTGTLQLIPFIQPTGIASSESYGTPKLDMFITPAGISSSEVHGDTLVSYDQTIVAIGIASAAILPSPKVINIFNKIIPNAGGFIFVTPTSAEDFILINPNTGGFTQ